MSTTTSDRVGQPRPSRWRSCEIKRRYCKSTAQRIALDFAKRDNDETVWAYKCDYCDSWHVGHKRKDWQR